jgi:hypothetical protein
VSGPIEDRLDVGTALDLIGRKAAGKPAPMACCPRDGEPLIGTFERAGAEFLQQMIYQQVGNARARILRELVDVYPDSITRADLAARLDYHERTKGFTNALGSLRTLGLVDYPTPGVVAATDLLFLDR